MKHSDSITELAAALVKAQGEMKNPAFDSVNPHFKNKFASLAIVRDTVTPVLTKNGLTVTQLLGHQEGGITCETVLMHSSGQWLSESLYMPATKLDAQGYGSAITYARRYSLMAICGVVGDEDDDANEASKPNRDVKNQIIPYPTTITPTTGAWESLDENTRSRLTDVANVTKEYLNESDIEGAVNFIESNGLCAEEKIALWTQFDSKQRSAMKRAKQEMAMRATPQL